MTHGDQPPPEEPLDDPTVAGVGSPVLPAVTPTPRRVTMARAGLLAAVGLALLAPPAALAFDAVRRSPSTAPTTAPAGRADPDEPAQAAQEDGRSGTVADPPASAPDGSVEQRILTALRRQGKALLDGDAAGFVAPAEPANAALRGDLSRRFGSLRALQVSRWEPRITGESKAAADGTLAVPVQIRYCFVVPDCSLIPLPVETRWAQRGGDVWLTVFGTATELGPRPWEVSDLRVAVGARVIVAATPRNAAKLPATLVAAEKAAEVTDRYAKWAPRPSRYVVFLAGPDEWSSWYGIKQDSWVAAYAMPLTDESTEIVLNAGRVDARETQEVLRHELTHVVTLVGVRRSYEHSWWLVEGIAEYVRVIGTGRTYDGMGEVRKYVQSGRWSGDVVMDDPDGGASSTDVSGRYGVAYLAVRRLADRFGEDRMLDFFAAVARDGVSLADASAKVFGQPWTEVSADCGRYVRSRL